MSFDNYVNHISQKYSLAIAIAIIKTKPNNTTIEAYINELKQKVIDQSMDSDDLDITLCSDDFNIDDYDNDILIVNDNNYYLSTNNRNNDDNHVIVDENDVMMDDTQINDSITILNDFEDITVVKGHKNEGKDNINEFSNVFGMLSEVDENCLKEKQINTFNPNDKTQTDSQITYCDVDLIDNDTTFYKSIDFNDSQIRTNNIDKTMNQDLGVEGNENHLDERNKSNNNKGLISENEIRNEIEDQNIAIDTTHGKSAKNIDPGTKDGQIKGIDTIDSQKTIIYTLYGLTENYSHVSQSQNENLIISDKYIHGIDKLRDRNGENTNSDKPYTIENEEANNKQINTSQNEIFTQNAQGYDFSHNNTQEFTKTNDCTEIKNAPQNEQVIEEELSDSQVDLIPFKVIEELSKVKGFLNRKFDRRMSTDGFSTDSGYKSDSQHKSSGKSALLSGTWVNQSAHSLYNFITVCPLMVNTQDINNEISKVLGELIDKLHEEEKYPYFLEELLESVKLLLRRIYEEEGGTENELLKKDESIQRLLLLNKSMNIQKFCIEKITNILEEAHANLMKDEEQFEILQINKIENLSYIFHILEIVLKRYMKCKDLTSQSSRTSQEEKLKRSSITDIWRKKWNPNYKEICVNEGSLEKKCVLVKCSEVLNKIIVNCMESYSLIAYAALQCFNLLQS